jgi:predicted metal-dependent HD superfamily phosphohydrolase
MDQQRFIDLWVRAGSSRGEDRAAAVFKAVRDHYDEPHRVYHTADHIRHCLREVDRIPDDYEHKTAVEIAIWFHDVIYEIGDPGNEANSADWFKKQAQGDLPDAIIDQVYRMIIATEHREPAMELDSAYVVDVDLSSFGLPFDEFAVDSAMVRAENIHLTDAQFFQGQKQFLLRLLERDRIFQTELFNGLYEAQARSNIRRTLASMP